MEYSNFAEFLADKRREKGISVRKFASAIGCVPGFVTNLEKDNCYPPKFEKLEKIAETLQLSDEERHLMYDLGGKKRDDVPADLPPYLIPNKLAAEGIRAARDVEANEEDWAEFIQYLKNKSRR